MVHQRKHKTSFKNRMVILGFGCLGRSVLPVIFQNLMIKPSQISIIANDSSGEAIANEFGLSLELETITKENYRRILEPKLHEGDFLVNLSVNISSHDLILMCRERGVLYTDMSTEPWAGGYIDCNLTPASRTNYVLRESVIHLKGKPGPTAVLTHGANPGLVSHFIKHALCQLAEDIELNVLTPQSREDWAMLAHQLNVKTIHVAECDTQTTNRPKEHDEFVNTWSVDGFVSEGSQPAELGWGTHERYWPSDAHHHDHGPRCSIYLNRPGASVKVRTWTPLRGAFHGYLITHAESISIPNYFTLEDKSLIYRPTVHYAYSPCPDAILSIHELGCSEWKQQSKRRLIFDEIVDGIDELGVLLMGHAKGAYWYGSQLSIHEARKIAPHNNATSMQVVAGIIAAILWAIENPQRGVVEPDDLDHRFVMSIAEPYLGKVTGHYTDWTPLKHRKDLFPEKIDRQDPWQFINIRVN